MRIASAWLLVVFCAVCPRLTAEDAIFESDEVKIRYVMAGEGTPVILIHGWMSDCSMWGKDRYGAAKLNAEGAKGFQLIALDCRGHGKSSKLHTRADYGTKMAEDVVRLLDHLKLEKAHLVGYSSGAYIAGYLAVHHPKRVLSVVYAAQAPIVKTDTPSGSAEVQAFVDALKAGQGMGPYLLAVTPADQPKPTLDEANRLTRFLYRGKDLQAFAAAGESFPDLAITAEQLKAIAVPQLFIHGEDESAAVKDSVAAAHKVLARGEVVLIPKANHMTTLAKPEFTEALLKFLHKADTAAKKP